MAMLVYQRVMFHEFLDECGVLHFRKPPFFSGIIKWEQNQRQRRSWINIVDKRSGWSGGCLYRLSFGVSLGFLRVSLRFFKGFFSVSSRVSLGQMMV